MSRVFSFRDLKLIPELSSLSEYQMLHPKNDAVVNKYLGQLGFNMNAAIQYIPAKHRDMQGNVGIGYRAVGEITQSRDFINSPLCSTIERLIAASLKDMSLTAELSKLLGNSVEFTTEDAIDEDDSYPPEWVEPDYKKVEEQIKEMVAYRDVVRGSAHNERGELKKPGEYYNG